jgi:hypothetical protein
MRTALLLAMLAGCGGNIAFEDYLDEQRDARCGYYVRCGTVSTVGDCRAYFARTETSNASLAAAVSAGKIRYDSDAAESCIAAFDVLDCDYADQGPDALAPCDEVFTGAIRNGGDCAFDTECTSGQCSIPDCTSSCCMGTCDEPRVYPGLGEPCTTICDGDLFCNFDQICQAPVGEGESCNGFSVCAEPLVCNGICVPRPARGEACIGFCATEGDVCGPELLCVPARIAGDDCATQSECSYFYYCNFDTRSCEQMPQTPGLPNGSTCSFSSECTSRYCDGECADAPVCY